MNERIKLVRKTLGLSQQEFGEKLGVSRDVISNIEYRHLKPKELLVRHIAALYGVNLSWLLYGEGDMMDSPSDNNSKLSEAMEIFQTLKPEFQDCALAQIKELAKLQENQRAK